MKKLIATILALTLALSLVGCGKTETAQVDLGAVYESLGEYLPEMYSPDGDTLLNFMGIDEEDCQQLYVSICAEGMDADEVWLIQAKDATALDTLKELAQTRIQAKLDETETYLPDQYVVVQKAELVVKDLYLALLISPQVDTMKETVLAALG